MSKRNRSYTYILPMLRDEVLDGKDFISNTYIKDVNDFTDKRRLYLELNFDVSNDYTMFEEHLEDSMYYVDKYDISSTTTIMVLDIPRVYYEDYDLIMKGKYSEISEYLKEDIRDYHDLTDFSFVYGVLYRKEYAYKLMEARINKGLKKKYWTYIPREQEIGILIDVEEETFKKKTRKILN